MKKFRSKFVLVMIIFFTILTLHQVRKNKVSGQNATLGLPEY
jgi:hypothetical protein